MIRLKMEFSMKEMLYKNRIKKIEEANEKKLLELTEMHENTSSELKREIEQMTINYEAKIKELGGTTEKKIDAK